jgi:hypothetical protein
MKPLTGKKLVALPKGAKVRLHPKYVDYRVNLYGDDRIIVESVYSLMEAKERAIGGNVDVVVLNDSYDDERVKAAVDKYGWGVATLEPMFVSVGSVSSSFSPTDTTPAGFCSCPNPNLVKRSVGGDEYDYCLDCKNERK